MKLALTLACIFAAAGPLAAAGQSSHAPSRAEIARWKQEAARVTIIRDDWGIAHVYGHTDADAVFGMEYAQAEDDFNRVETNYMVSMGRLAEAEGPSAIYQDLRAKMYINQDTLKRLYATSPAWLVKLMNSFADGLNFYLYTHPDVHPRVITRFEPWMALSFSEGSIGPDIERANLRQLQAFYTTTDSAGVQPAGGLPPAPDPDTYIEPTGSNGIAFAPSRTADHHAILWINPHTSFFFRSELQMVSDEGLDAYGAVTWGQFFIYQGFNPGAGWMHTSSNVDAIDNYLETVSQRDGRWYYKYGTKELPVTQQQITIPYKTPNGMARKTFTAYFTQHGPVIAKVGDKWMTIRLMNKPVEALIQSFTRTKARDYAAYKRTMELHANSSNNTIFADSKGNIAYFQANFIPRRDTSFDWTKPVDGSNPATDWRGVLSVDESPNLLNPATGWLYNSNNWPWSAAGPDSPKREDFPKYVENSSEESARGYHMLRMLPYMHNVTPDSVIKAAFDSYLPPFATLIPPLVAAWDALPATDTLKAKLAGQIGMLRDWDYRWGVNSIATSLAMYWGEGITRRVGPEARRAGMPAADYAATLATGAERLESLAAASDRMTADFGTWRTPWGEINRFQRINDDIDPHFDDAGPSIPIGFVSNRWGSIASFGARQYPNTKKWYGTSGNSFVAVVDFGDSIRARAVTVGGESGHPGSPHFDDEAERYATGNLRTVYFYKSQLKGHTERTYHPGR